MTHSCACCRRREIFGKMFLKRLIDIVIFLAERNMAFREYDEQFESRSNGNFLGTFELVAKYDNVLEDILRRVKPRKKLLITISVLKLRMN
jgi:hypothetical protein